jgi:hypothetical protein
MVCLIGAKMPSIFRGGAMKYFLGVLLCGLAVLTVAMPLAAQSDLDQRVGKGNGFARRRLQTSARKS